MNSTSYRKRTAWRNCPHPNTKVISSRHQNISLHITPFDHQHTFGWKRSHSGSSGPWISFTNFPLDVFQSFRFPFISMVAHKSPLGLKQTPHTLSVWPDNSFTSSGLLASKRKARLSWPPVRTWPGLVGLSAMHKTESVCSSKLYH